MSFEDILLIILSIFSFIAFGTMFVIILVRAVGPKKLTSQHSKGKGGQPRRFISEEI